MADINVSLGDLRDRITFQSPTISVDDGGAQVVSWADISATPTVWARWVNAHGAEVVASDALKFTQRATVLIRYRTDVSTTWRVLRNGEYWQVISVDHIHGRRHWTELVVERVKGTL